MGNLLEAVWFGHQYPTSYPVCQVQYWLNDVWRQWVILVIWQCIEKIMGMMLEMAVTWYIWMGKKWHCKLLILEQVRCWILYWIQPCQTDQPWRWQIYQQSVVWWMVLPTLPISAIASVGYVRFVPKVWQWMLVNPSISLDSTQWSVWYWSRWVTTEDWTVISVVCIHLTLNHNVIVSWWHVVLMKFHWQ